MNDAPTNITVKTRKPLAVTILFAIEIVIVLILVASNEYMSGLGEGGILFVPLYLLAYGALFGAVTAIPTLSIVALTSKISLTTVQKIAIWVALVVNVLAILALMAAIVQLFVVVAQPSRG